MKACCLWQNISRKTSMVLDIPNLPTGQDFPDRSQEIPNLVCCPTQSSAVSLAKIATVAVTSGQDVLSGPAQQQKEDNCLYFGLTRHKTKKITGPFVDLNDVKN